jgi:hypothetical protein
MFIWDGIPVAALARITFFADYGSSIVLLVLSFEFEYSLFLVADVTLEIFSFLSLIFTVK